MNETNWKRWLDSERVCGPRPWRRGGGVRARAPHVTTLAFVAAYRSELLA